MPRSPETQRALGEVIFERRNELKMSQEDVALAAGTTQGRISQIESGHNPSFALARRVARALGWSSIELMRRIEEREARR